MRRYLNLKRNWIRCPAESAQNRSQKVNYKFPLSWNSILIGICPCICIYSLKRLLLEIYNIEIRPNRGGEEFKNTRSPRRRGSITIFIFVFFYLGDSLVLFCTHNFGSCLLYSYFLPCFYWNPWWRLVLLWAKRCHGVLTEFSMEFSSSLP